MIVVSSGAVGIGRNVLGITEKPQGDVKQACAAVGQGRLMMIYEKLFAEYSQLTAQVLLTKESVYNVTCRNHAKQTFERLLAMNVIPIVNANDAISVDEDSYGNFGDNDTMSADVAALVNADLLIMMSDIEGLFDKDPHKYDDAELIPVVPEITEEIKAIAGGAGSSLGTGGMATKIKAAEICKNGGIDLIIMNGRDPRHLYKVFENKPIGTLFTANGEV